MLRSVQECVDRSWQECLGREWEADPNPAAIATWRPLSPHISRGAAPTFETVVAAETDLEVRRSPVGAGRGKVKVQRQGRYRRTWPVHNWMLGGSIEYRFLRDPLRSVDSKTSPSTRGEIWRDSSPQKAFGALDTALFRLEAE